MINKELLSWIQEQISKGVTKDEIGRLLRSEGWNDTDLSEAFTAISAPPVLQEISVPPSPAIANVAPLVATPTVAEGTSGRPAVTKLVVILLIVGSVFVAGGAVYAYVKKIGPFANPPYAEGNLLSGLLDSFSSINTSAYSFSGSLTTSSRDADAKPFVMQLDGEAETRKQKQYKNDFQRAEDADKLLYALNSLYGEYADLPYPSNIDQILADASKSSFYQVKNIKDPATGDKYLYAVIDDGKNFTLAITFETKDAIYNIQKSIELMKAYRDIKDMPVISGQTVKFTNNNSLSLSYILTPEPPEPFFNQMQEMISSAPPEMSVLASVSASTDWTKSNADWKFNIGASGDLGDLTYKIDADALKKSGTYYLRINNFPSLFGFPPASMKGQWAKFDPTTASSTSSDYSEGSYITSSLSTAEEKYKKNRSDFVDLLKKVSSVADKTRLVSFKNDPVSESVDKRTLYRYDLQINKSALLVFYRQMAVEIDQKSQYAEIFNNPGVEENLRGEEFNQVFDYYLKNTTLTLWVDPLGLPAIVKYSIRIIPPDTASVLKDKQFNMEYQISVSDINKPIDISAPADAKTIEELLGEEGASSSSSKARDAKRIADTASTQMALALYYDSNGKYPAGIADLVTAGFLPDVPTGPNSGETYKYIASSDGLSYHLGTALEQVSADTGVLASDIDCSSAVGGSPLCSGFSKGVEGGFDGSDGEPCGATTGACYDLNP